MSEKALFVICLIMQFKLYSQQQWLRKLENTYCYDIVQSYTFRTHAVLRCSAWCRQVTYCRAFNLQNSSPGARCDLLEPFNSNDQLFIYFNTASSVYLAQETHTPGEIHLTGNFVYHHIKMFKPKMYKFV